MSAVTNPKPLIAANWKMQLSQPESIAAATKLSGGLKNLSGQIELVLCPSFTALGAVGDIIRTGPIKLGTQDMFWADRGAYTGEISPLDLTDLNVEYVIIGHSERRQNLGETDAMVASKLRSAISHGLTPILCVGESAAERDQGQQEQVIGRQLLTVFEKMTTISHSIYIAYEPIWAIGTGQPADPTLAETMRQFIEQTLIDQYSAKLVADQVRVIYGGSVDAKNVTNYIKPGGFHGALIGTASLKPEPFITLINKVEERYA